MKTLEAEMDMKILEADLGWSETWASVKTFLGSIGGWICESGKTLHRAQRRMRAISRQLTLRFTSLTF